MKGLPTILKIAIIVPFILGILLFVVLPLRINHFYKKEQERERENAEIWKNKDNYLSQYEKLFSEKQKVKDVGITKYNDFYIITYKNDIILPYGSGSLIKKDSQGKIQYYHDQFNPLLPNDVRLNNLKKLIGKEIKIKVLGDKKHPYEYKINGNYKQDTYPLNQNIYYMADITFDDNHHLDMNFNSCDFTPINPDDLYCGPIYPRQKWYEGEKY